MPLRARYPAGALPGALQAHLTPTKSLLTAQLTLSPVDVQHAAEEAVVPQSGWRLQSRSRGISSDHAPVNIEKDSAWVFAAVSWCWPLADSPLDPPYQSRLQMKEEGAADVAVFVQITLDWPNREAVK